MHDYLIIGFGVAGASLARHLQKAGADIVVLNYEDTSSSSMVAAGLVNPITGRAFSLTWRASEVFPYIHSYYGELEAEHQVPVFHPMPIYRVCASMRELNDWSAKAGHPEYSSYVTDGFEPDAGIIDAPWGTIGTGRGGYVNIPEYLELVKKELGARYVPVKEMISEEEIEVQSSHIQWKEHRARQLVLCDGYLAYQRKYFGYLPFTPMKGEILELELPGMYKDRILIRSGFVVPFGNKIHLAGATYDWKNINTNPTGKAREEILERLTGYVRTPIHVRGHRAGVRPAVKDRKPLLGTHPEFGNVHLFNGMGSKGTSLSPYLGKIFSDYLLEGNPIPVEVNIKRFG